MYKSIQLDLFKTTSLNPTYEIKRQIRLAIAGSSLSRVEIADQMNAVAVSEGMRKKISKDTLDSWTKDSEPDRLPSPPWLTIFCLVLKTTGPLNAIVRPLGMDVIGPNRVKVLAWGRAELEKRKAIKAAKIKLESIE